MASNTAVECNPCPVRHTVVFFHAHPDDEALLTSGTMAKLAAQGHRVVLVVATAGEAGLAADELRSDGRLGERRLAELERLGAAPSASLGWRCSDTPIPASWPETQHAPRRPGRPRFVDAEPEEVSAAARRPILTASGPSVVTTLRRGGGYGHPDHLTVHASVRSRPRTRGNARWCWRRPSRGTGCWPRPACQSAAARSRRVDLDPGRGPTPAAAEITHRIDVRGQARRGGPRCGPRQSGHRPLRPADARRLHQASRRRCSAESRPGVVPAGPMRPPGGGSPTSSRLSERVVVDRSGFLG